MSRRTYAGNEIWFDAEMVVSGVAEELVECMAFCCAVKRSAEGTVTEKLVTADFYFDQWVGIVIAYKPSEGEGGDRRNKDNKGGACGERESKASGETGFVRGADGCGMGQPKVGDGGRVL